MTGMEPRAPTPRAARAALALFLLAAAPIPALADAPRAEIESEIKRLAASGRYQMEMPTPEPPPPPRQRANLQPFELSDLGQFALIVVVAALVVYALFSLATRRPAPRKGALRKGAVVARAAPAPEAPTEEALADAESRARAAAREGRYAEAIHILLLGAIGHLRERDARATARSLTSREILDRVFGRDGSPEGRRALAALVLAVEISRFGGRAADFEAFTRCHEAYQALRAAIATPGFSRRSDAPRIPAQA